MKFYDKIGNDLFAPNISVTSILLDDGQTLETTSATDQSIITTNGINVDTIIQSKQNNIDNWVTDIEYLQYTTINFIVFQDKNKAEIFDSQIKHKKYTLDPIGKIATDAGASKINSINISDIVDLEQYSTSEPVFESYYSYAFSDLDPKKDIILYIVPSINFSSFFEDNGLDATKSETINLIKQIYSVETHKFNILINNKTIDDQVSEQILSDVRQVKNLKNNLLSLLSTIKIDDTITNEKPSYISNIFANFDYENEIVRSYFFFDIKNFIKDNTVFDRVFDTKTSDEINQILKTNNSIFFTVTNKIEDLEEVVCTFTTTYQSIIGSNNASIIDSLTNDNFVCYSFSDLFPATVKQKFNYSINVRFIDPFLKSYYEPSTSSGKYFTVLQQIQDIENFVNDPNNTDARTGKFTKIYSLDKLKGFMKDFFELINLFSEKLIDPATINKIVSALDTRKVSYLVYNDFILFAKKGLTQLEGIFTSAGQHNTQYNKDSETIQFVKNDFYFQLNDYDRTSKLPKLSLTTQEMQSEISTKYYTDSDKKRYNLKSSVVDSTNVVSYKIANSVFCLKQPEVTYSSEYSFLSDVLSLEGTTIEKTNLISKKQDTKSIFDKTSISNDVVQKPALQIGNSSKEMKPYLNSVQSTKIGTLIDKINTSKQIDTETMLQFQMLYLNQMSDSFLIPQIKIEVYDHISKQWKSFSTANGATNTYLARTTYIQNNNIFSNNKVVPPITNKYFIVETKTA